MKSNLFTLILLLVLSLNSFQAAAFSKTNTPLPVPELSESYEYFRVFDAVVYDNTILIIGEYQKDKKGDYIYFMRSLNTSEEILWEKQMDYKPAALEKVSDSEFWVAGSKTDPVSKKSEIRLNKYNLSGKHLSQNTISDPSLSYVPNDLVIQDQGNILVCGTNEDLKRSYDRMLVVSIQPDGRIIWKKIYDKFKFDYESIKDIVAYSDGSFAFTGYSRGFGPEKFTLITAKAFPNGELEWVQKYGGEQHIDQNDAYPNNVLINKKGQTVIVGRNNADGIVHFIGEKKAGDLMVLNYDTYGEYNWEYTLGEKASIVNEKGLDIIEKPNGDYMVLGSIAKNDDVSGKIPVLITLSSEGEEISTRVIGSKYDNYYHLIMSEANNQLFVIGTYKGDDERYQFALKAIKPSEL